MGVSYNWNANAGTVEVRGVCGDDDLGTATIEVNSLMRRMKQLQKKQYEEDFSEEEETELNILGNFIQMEDEEDN